jgi:dipeptidyl aminopeptidase/acylaminoacyl peptidase
MWTRRKTLAAGLGAAGAAAWPPLGAAAPGAAPSTAPSAADAAPPPVEAFFGPPVLAGAVLSPDGTKVAMRVAARDGGRIRLAVLDLKTMTSAAIAAITDSDIEQLDWVGDGQLVFDTSQQLVEYGRADFGRGLFAVDVRGESLRELVSTRGQPADGVPRTLLHWAYELRPLAARPGGDEVLVVRPEEMSAERIGHYSLRWLDVTRRTSREVEIPTDSEAWAFDARGRLRAAVVRRGLQQSLQWRQDDGSWKPLHRWERHDGQGWTPLYVDSEDRLYVVAPHQGRMALFLCDARAGRLSDKPLASHPQFDVDPQLLVRQGRVVGLRYTIDAEVTQWLDPRLQALQAEVDKRLPDTVNRLGLPQHGESTWVLVEAFSDRQPYRAFAHDTATKRMVRLGDSRPGIDPRRMGSTDLHWITARDGRSLPVWVTMPPGARPKQPLPAIVWVHGGPWARGMHWHWHPEVQFLASRGYVVLQPEFRGSRGFGQEHFRAGWKQWGQAMQADLADAARWAVAQSIADPQRIGLLGASYGGYATLMGLAQEPQLFRAGVAWVAVSDLDMMYGLRWSDFTQETRALDLPRLMGDRVADAAMLRANSPVHLAGRITNPLLLAHGAWDVRVPLDHAEALRKALAPHNSRLEWVVYDNEGHGWRRPENLTSFWQRVERFLTRHLASPAG